MIETNETNYSMPETLTWTPRLNFFVPIEHADRTKRRISEYLFGNGFVNDIGAYISQVRTLSQSQPSMQSRFTRLNVERVERR